METLELNKVLREFGKLLMIRRTDDQDEICQAINTKITLFEYRPASDEVRKLFVNLLFAKIKQYVENTNTVIFAFKRNCNIRVSDRFKNMSIPLGEVISSLPELPFREVYSFTGDIILILTVEETHVSDKTTQYTLTISGSGLIYDVLVPKKGTLF